MFWSDDAVQWEKKLDAFDRTTGKPPEGHIIDKCGMFASHWRDLWETVEKGNAATGKPPEHVAKNALRIIRSSEEHLAVESKLPEWNDPKWDSLAWEWAEEQRLDFPKEGMETTGKARHAMRRAFAALAISLDQRGSEIAMDRVEQLAD